MFLHLYVPTNVYYDNKNISLIKCKKTALTKALVLRTLMAIEPIRAARNK